MPRSLSNPTVAAQPKPAVKQKDRDPVAAGMRDAAFNRAASHNYELSDRFEAGVALRGTEVKSIREGKANLKDAYGCLLYTSRCRRVRRSPCRGPYRARRR